MIPLARACTVTWVARMPNVSTSSISKSNGSTGSEESCLRISSKSAPASSSAPRAMSPEIPATQSKYATRTRLRRPGPDDPVGHQGGPEAVVDVDHGDARRAGGQHGQQRGQPPERGPVADAGGYGDHRPGGQPRHHRRQRSLHD